MFSFVICALTLKRVDEGDKTKQHENNCAMQQDKFMLMLVHGHHINYNKCALRSILSGNASNKTKMYVNIIILWCYWWACTGKRSVNKMEYSQQ